MKFLFVLIMLEYAPQANDDCPIPGSWKRQEWYNILIYIHLGIWHTVRR